MRKLFSFNMVTLDGFFEGPNQDISWHNKNLKLIKIRVFGNENVLLCYQPDRK
jgi:hypothetical protein